MGQIITPSAIPYKSEYKRTQNVTVEQGTAPPSSSSSGTFMQYYTTANSAYQVGESGITTSSWVKKSSQTIHGVTYDTFQRTQRYYRFYVAFPVNLSSYAGKAKRVLLRYTVSAVSESTSDSYSCAICPKLNAGSDLSWDSLKPDTSISIGKTFSGSVPRNETVDVTSIGLVSNGYVIGASGPRRRNITISNINIEVQFQNSVYIKVSGVWKEGTPYVNVNGVWKEGTLYTNVLGTWKEGSG